MNGLNFPNGALVKDDFCYMKDEYPRLFTDVPDNCAVEKMAPASFTNSDEYQAMMHFSSKSIANPTMRDKKKQNFYNFLLLI